MPYQLAMIIHAGIGDVFRPVEVSNFFNATLAETISVPVPPISELFIYLQIKDYKILSKFYEKNWHHEIIISCITKERNIQTLVLFSLDAFRISARTSFFAGVDRTVGGYGGLIAAQDCLPNNEKRDAFAAEYSVLSRIWEALSPDPCLSAYETDYRWVTQVYESVKPPSGNGKLLWHVLGAKTIELIHQNTHLDTVRDDIETLVMDAEVLESVLGAPDPGKKGKTLEINLVARLRKHGKDPKFVALGERLEKIRERHEQGLIESKEFLKELLELAKDVLEAEKHIDPVEEQDKAKAALTELFQQVKNADTPVIVERIVADIDEIVRMVRFPGWQQTSAGEREVQKALRKTLLKYHLHKDQDLFDRAYGYIRQYY